MNYINHCLRCYDPLFMIIDQIKCLPKPIYNNNNNIEQKQSQDEHISSSLIPLNKAINIIIFTKNASMNKLLCDGLISELNDIIRHAVFNTVHMALDGLCNTTKSSSIGYNIKN
eukprot:228116_1